ncbi:patatin-like phospholipase family protein [Anaerofustis sp.]|uniref:patatin-like phospholipase family protein n=1 Tax=Anaerofustis sp. TaxID=1872517 RepID=UPI0025BD4E5C|nr:patatin-like phospholipase family protein [Anaerofustis sp.]
MFNFIKKKKKGICFSGGGIKGFAHIGVIKALEENGIKFDMVSGNSAGSIVGALYALGVSADEMLDYSLSMEVRDIINYKSVRNKLSFESPKEFLNSFKGLSFSPSIDSKNIEDFFIGIGGDKLFNETLIPFYVVSVDLKSGGLVVMDKGRLATAVRASSAIPGVFTPVVSDKYTLVDGLVLNNMPADILKDKGCDKVLSVNLKAYSKIGTDSTKYFDMIFATMDIMAARSLIKGIESSDLILNPYLEDTKVKLDENYIKQVYDFGYKEAVSHMNEIVKMFK